MTSSRKRRVAGGAALLLWAVLTAYGVGQLWMYHATPGAQKAAPSTIAERSDRYALFLFLHPRCPCSNATVAELARLMAQAGPRIDAKVLILASKDDEASWSQSSLAASASTIPGVSIVPDWEGASATQYGAMTSGHVVLYRPDGNRAFVGGITASRGHEGDNYGTSTILAIVSGSQSTGEGTPVFGCALSHLPVVSSVEQQTQSHKGDR